MDEQEQKSNYEQKKREVRDLYSKFGKVHCPALGNEWVHFTSEGFNHLIYKRAKKERDKRVQMMKFKLLPRAKTLLEVTTTFQEYEEGYEFRKVRRYGKWVDENVLVRFWGFIALIKNFRVKVVVRQIGNGKKEFYSVIPAWVTRYYRDIKLIETSKGGLRNEDDGEELKNATLSGGL